MSLQDDDFRSLFCLIYDLNVEGHLQMGYNSKTIKNYNKPVETQPVQTQLVETQPVQSREEPPNGEEEE